MWTIDFPAQAALPAGTIPALVDIRSGWPVVVFPAGTSCRADFIGLTPHAYQGEGLRVAVLASFFGHTNPQHRAIFELAVERLPGPGAQLQSPSEGLPQQMTLPVPAEEGTLVAAEALLPAGQASAYLAGGELFRLRIQLQAGMSTFAGRCELLRVIIRPVE